MKWIGIMLLACVACRRDGAAPKPQPVIAADPSASASAVASASAAQPAPPPAPPDQCVAYRARRDARLQKAVAGLADAGWSETELVRQRGDVGLDCFSFGRGAWWVEPGADLDVSYGLLTSNETIHARVDGTTLGPWSPDGKGIHVGYGGSPASLQATMVSDYDGDGVPELYVRTDEDGVEGGHVTESWIVSVHGATLREYPPSKDLGTIDTPVDVDGDGRLDLPVSRGLATVEGECMGKPTYHPADFLAHALPDGSFSTTDAVAMKHVLRWCPAMPARLATREDVLCARLRTRPADLAKTRARITASCVPWDCPAQIAGQAQKPGASQLCTDLLDTFDQDTNISL